MPGLIQGLEIARRALLAHQSSMTITGHNIANVATEGYSRQRPNLVPDVPEKTPWGIVGTGVRLEDVQRARDTFLDAQFRQEKALAGEWEARSQVLGQIEGVIGEPSDTGVAALLDNFFNAWYELSNQPEDFGTRSVVLRAGEELTDGLANQRSRFRDLLESTDTNIAQRVVEINEQLDEVARLNLMIQQSETTGGTDADLRDRRDLLLDGLADQAGAEHLERADGTVVVRLGSRTVVDGTEVTSLRADRYTVSGRLNVRIVFASDGTAPSNIGGQLGGLVHAREEVIPEVMSQFDTLVGGLVQQVNQLHRAGPTGVDFFRGSTAEDMEVTLEVQNDPSLINAGSSGDPGDNDIAVAIAQLRDSRFLLQGTATPGDYYRQLVNGVGSMARQADSFSTSQGVALEAVENQRQAVNGVSLDEELTNLVESQKAYEAAARVFTTASQMIDVLLAI